MTQGNVKVKVGPSDEEKKTKNTKEIQTKCFNFLDKNIPRRVKPTLELSPAFIPIMKGLMAKDRRLTPSAQKELFLKKYTLTAEQKEELDNLFSLAKSTL